MTLYGPDRAEILIFTHKEGLLSPVAHDLQIRAERFEIAEDGTAVRARVEAGSLRVVCAMREGREEPSLLSAANRAEIEENIRNEVLHTGRYASVVFESTALTPGAIAGRLSLHGTTREVRATLRSEGGFRVAELRLDQRDYGIKPFTALFGALKVRPEVRVTVRVPALAAAEGAR